jgi:alpha-L-arabinofuranosidase
VKSLDQIAIEQGTDRSSIRNHDYMRTYDELFSPRRHQPLTFMEMGTLCMEGMRTWVEYFTHPQAKIYGIDIQDWGVKPPNDPRITFRLGSEADPVFLATLAPAYDIVIDDAGHFASQQIAAFGLLWPRITPGGLYAIEDLHTAWAPQHCDAPLTIMQFIERIMEEMQDHAGATGQARPNSADKWHSIDQIILRKGLAVFKKAA